MKKTVRSYFICDKCDQKIISDESCIKHGGKHEACPENGKWQKVENEKCTCGRSLNADINKGYPHYLPCDTCTVNAIFALLQNESFWKPLIRYLGSRDKAKDWMYMHTIHKDDVSIYAYKHSITRQYLYLDNDLNVWKWHFQERYFYRNEKVNYKTNRICLGRPEVV